MSVALDQEVRRSRDWSTPAPERFEQEMLIAPAEAYGVSSRREEYASRDASK